MSEIVIKDEDSHHLCEITEFNPVYSLGIDIGYSSVKIALLNDSNAIVYTDYILHKGKIKETLKKILKKIPRKYNLDNITTGAVTGSESKFTTRNWTIQHINDVLALVEGCLTIQDTIKSIIEIGGESAKYITGLNKDNRSTIQISMNSSCSAGTGSFLEEQTSRLNLDIEDYSSYAANAIFIPRIAGRCSVFAKTDIIHHQQEGVPIEDILLGLAYALIRNYRGTVIKKFPLEKPIMLTGGVAYNDAIVGAVKDVLNLREHELVVCEKCGNTAAVGAARVAKNDHLRLRYKDILDILDSADDRSIIDTGEDELPALNAFGDGDSKRKHLCKPFGEKSEKSDCYLGIDVGSTSTNLVLMNPYNEILSYRYLKTLGDPFQSVKKGFNELKNEIGDKINILGVGITGSGRHMIGRLIGADVIKDEITAQAKAATTIDRDVDTVFEIGGQDSKYISLHDGMVTDFQMNKICAAGTGSFIEEQSKKFDIPINNFGTIAINSRHPVHLGERCTVFIETSIATHLSSGTKIDDIAAGLCYSIAKNYLNRVVGQNKIGEKIFLQGGIAYNQGVVNAFRALTGKEIIVPPFFSVTGAYGAAILTKDEMNTAQTKFKGFDIRDAPRITLKSETPKTESRFDNRVNELIFEGYDGSYDEDKPIIGIPRALFTYGMYPMFSTFFRDLGFNVILSDPTNEETVRLGQEYSLDETCYPVKLINGHVAELVQKKVDYIFFPDLFTVPHPGSHSRQDYGCPYMQIAFKMVNKAMELDKKGIKLLSPTFGFSLGEEFMKKSFMDLGRKLGKDPEETLMALQKGMKAFLDFETRIEETSRELVKNLRPDEKAFVIISKTYGVSDPALNLGIPDRLAEKGYKVLAFYNLPGGDISKEHPNMYWPFGQHILEAAQIVKAHPNLYAIFLTHHGCGPDTVFSHYFREIMDGKPYLNIEVDEHSSDVGVITRLEAFINSLNTIPAGTADALETYPGKVAHRRANITPDRAELEDGATIYVPNIYPYSHIYCASLKNAGIHAQTLPAPDFGSINAGRKYALTNEYFSLIALIGDVVNFFDTRTDHEKPSAILIPQSEGAEVDGQYNRILRTILDAKELKDIAVVAPFVEDALLKDATDLDTIFLVLIAGDIVRNAPPERRDDYLDMVLEASQDGRLHLEFLKELAGNMCAEHRAKNYKKTILAIGEPMILFNDYLNNATFKNIEENHHRVVYAPLSESMWLLWNDFIVQNGKKNKTMLHQKLEVFEDAISQISGCLSEYSPFEKHVKSLAATADSTLGYYAGAFGRYRGAKTRCAGAVIDGIITVASIYENTGIALNTLHQGDERNRSKPILNLTFDGNENENTKTKIESFLYYL
ncbi:CoA activase [Methanofollis aquaemaris]|uniref:CoA activase n=2 Tax=Methanofollis aquaemaris TaxID=126734 RepID=A0A8A3SAA5_9EURY|nr:CoA activase [Methanofollis aquaemaris]